MIINLKFHASKSFFPSSLRSAHKVYAPSAVPYGKSARSTEPSINAPRRDQCRRRRSGNTDGDVHEAPEDRDHRQRSERGGGQTRREVATSLPARRCEQGCGGQAQRERGEAHNRCESAPDDHENGNEFNVRGHRGGR